MNKIEYVSLCDGTYTFKVDFENKTYKEVYSDGIIKERYEKNTIVSEAFNIERFLQEEGFKPLEFREIW